MKLLDIKRFGIMLQRRRILRNRIISDIAFRMGGKYVTRTYIRNCPPNKRWLWRIHRNASRNIENANRTIQQLKREMSIIKRRIAKESCYA